MKNIRFPHCIQRRSAYVCTDSSCGREGKLPPHSDLQGVLAVEFHLQKEKNGLYTMSSKPMPYLSCVYICI